jgi:hypothetical protein
MVPFIRGFVIPFMNGSALFAKTLRHFHSILILLSGHSRLDFFPAAILKSKKNELDMNYIEQWATRAGLSSLWKGMLGMVS